MSEAMLEARYSTLVCRHEVTSKEIYMKRSDSQSGLFYSLDEFEGVKGSRCADLELASDLDVNSSRVMNACSHSLFIWTPGREGN
jgi:hypothetical protein